MNLSRLTLTGLALAAAVALHAKIVTKPVAYEHAGTKLEGYLAYDDAKTSADKKSPGVLVVPEWWGLTGYAKGRAEQLAQLGYVAFAADMYGAGVTTTDAKKAGELAGQFYGKPLMAERAQAGLDQLLASGLVQAEKVAAIGYCFGGSTVQALAYSGAPLAGIVSFHGGLIPVPAEAAAKTKAKILVCHGAVDGFISAADLAAFTKAMNDGKFDYQFIRCGSDTPKLASAWSAERDVVWIAWGSIKFAEVLSNAPGLAPGIFTSYAGAVHAFTNPGADQMAKANNLTGLAYNAAADRRSWGHMKQFLKEVLGETR